MNKINIDQALAALGDALKSQQDENPLANPLAFVKKLPWRSLSGDHVTGGKITNFSSSGITDKATKERIVISDTEVTIKSLSVDQLQKSVEIKGDVTASTVTANRIVADILDVKEIKADIKFEKNSSVVFANEIYSKGLLWTGSDYTKQFVYSGKPNRFFSSESIDIANDKKFSINGVDVLSSSELGSSVVKSNLREVGRLKGLMVDGSVSINSYMFYNASTDRLGIGTDQPNSALSVAENGIEVLVGTASNKGIIGTFASHGVDILTDNTPRISIESTGNILLGNKNTPPIQVSINGTLTVNVSTPDPRVKLDVGGAIKFNNALLLSSAEAPNSGSFNQGDIVWNAAPAQRKYIGWVCIKSGSPGIWCPFGEIR
jgi:hypothetical protein